MMLGLRDYVNKNRFPGVVLGLSGGIDSALSAAVAVDALGAERVRCVMLPSRYTTPRKPGRRRCLRPAAGRALRDHRDRARRGGVGRNPGAGLRRHQAPTPRKKTSSRALRGVILMAISNKFGPMVLTTGNKSEMSVGYATLYGDMCGGYNVLKDIYKTEVFAPGALAQPACRREGALGPQGRVIPERIIDKPPTAELRANQTDQDSLPPYDILDGILECLVEQEMSFEETVAQGLSIPPPSSASSSLLYVSEYKRRQAPPGVKISLAQFRPRPALSHHQCLPGRALMSCHRPLRAVAHRLAACRQCPHGAAQLSVRAQDGRQIPAAHRRHRCGALQAGI